MSSTNLRPPGEAEAPAGDRRQARLARFARNNALTLVVLGAFVVILFGQSVAGHRVYNEEQRSARSNSPTAKAQ